MTAPVPPQFDAEAGRSAELSELLGYLTACWDAERRMVARKLHDSLGSSMTALTMHLSLLTQQLPADPALQQRSAQMKALLLGIIDTNRELQAAIWNDKLEFLGVRAALSDMAMRFGAEHGIDTRVSLPDDDARHRPEQDMLLLRALEEGLRNVAAHARASAVDVVLDDNEEALMLTVRDNGAGLNGADPLSPGCHGLRLLRERARLLGGALGLDNGPDGGAALTLRLPRSPSVQLDQR